MDIMENQIENIITETNSLSLNEVVENSTTTIPELKKCSKCGKIKDKQLFRKEGHRCKDCHNEHIRNKYYEKKGYTPETSPYVNEPKEEIDTTKEENYTICKVCNVKKLITEYSKYNKSTCKICLNAKHKEYINSTDERIQKRKEIIKLYKQRKALEREEERLNKQKEIGINNKICKYCNQIKDKTRFRYNRQKCRDCERDEPIDKFKRVIRARIYNTIMKTKNTSEYLGCNINEYLEWMTFHTPDFKLETRENIWHIDHVIPLSHFDLSNENDIYIAFNWRNTQPLLANENLKKNNRLDIQQVADHYKKLEEFHTKTNIKIPHNFINLFAKHLDAGNSLEP